MKKNIYSLIILSTIIALIVNIFIQSQNLTNIIVFSINLFVKNIVPSLFPMFIISGILVEIGIPKYLGSLFNNIFKKVFRVPGSASFIFFMSMITGFPSSAKYINDLIDKKVINQCEAEKILTFTFFSNPLFIINTVGITFLENKKIGIYILISHVIGNIIIGIILRNYKSTSVNTTISFTSKDLINKINNTSIEKALFNSITNSIEILINVFGIVTFFLIVINTIIKTPNSYFKILITGAIEMTTGLKYLSIFNCPLKIKILTSTFFISFGGLSIHSQIMNILKEKKVKYLPFLISRIIHGIISSIICLLLTQSL